jgi:hypothetical protein
MTPGPEHISDTDQGGWIQIEPDVWISPEFHAAEQWAEKFGG